jgi:hypothetical protein
MILRPFTLFSWDLYYLFEILHFSCLFIYRSNTCFGMVMIARMEFIRSVQLYGQNIEDG